MQRERLNRSDDTKASIHQPRRLSIATDLLAGILPRNSIVRLHGFRLKPRGADVWLVVDDETGACVDAINLAATRSATTLLDHLAGLRGALDAHRAAERAEAARQ